LAKEWLLVLGALAVQLALLGHSIRANSAAFDESMHLAAGYRYWECGDFGINPEHPPLVKRLAALPVRRWPIGGFGRPCGERPVKNDELLGYGYRLLNGPQGDAALLAARHVLLVIPAALLFAVYLAARAWFGRAAAACALLLAVFEPNLLAHGPLITTDAALALATLLSVLGAWWYAERPSVARGVALALSLGIALGAKHSGVVVPGLVGLELAYLAWVRRRTAPTGWIARLAAGWVLAGLGAVFLLWAVYGFRYEAMPPGAAQGMALADATASPSPAPPAGPLPAPDLLRSAIHQAAEWRLLPESYLAGLLYVRDNASREAYFLGRERPRGTWEYFPVALSIKTTLPLLVLALAGLLGFARPREATAALGVLRLAIAVFLGAAIASRLNIGIRHVLPLYPLLLVCAGAAAAEALRRSRAVAVVAVVLLGWHAAASLRNHPDHIAYANEAWGGPARLHRYLGDSNADWGQALYRVRDHVARHAVGPCWIAWLGMRKPDAVGLPCGLLPAPMFLEIAEPDLPPPASPRFAGTVFVSATLAQRAVFGYQAFGARPPDDVIAGSVLVFRGSFDLPEVAALRNGSRGWWLLNHGRMDEARAELRLACASRSTIPPALLRGVWSEECPP
jgi:4-amino-4-deoxy-L-arabinose transferase-like glycosyltransferase